MAVQNPGTPWYAKNGSTNLSRAELSTRARRLLSSDAYIAALEKSLIDRSCPPAVEVTLYHYGWGKPAETVNVAVQGEDLSQMSAADLQHYAETVASALREAREIEEALQELEPNAVQPVHPTVM